MKKVLITIVGILALTSTNAQTKSTWTWFSDWHAETTLGVSEQSSYAYTNGTVIKGTVMDDENEIHLSVSNYYGEDGRIKIKFNIGNAGYRYDDSSENKNFLDILVIVDGNKNNILNMRGEIVNSNGTILVYGDDHRGVYDFLQSGKKIYFKLGTTQVYSFSCIGFSKAKSSIYDALKNQKSDNPFSSINNDEDPF